MNLSQYKHAYARGLYVMKIRAPLQRNDGYIMCGNSLTKRHGVMTLMLNADHCQDIVEYVLCMIRKVIMGRDTAVARRKFEFGNVLIHIIASYLRYPMIHLLILQFCIQ